MDIIFRSFSHFKSMRAIDPQGVDSLDPRGMVGRTLPYNKYIGCGPHGFRRFLSFSMVLNLWELMIPLVCQV